MSQPSSPYVRSHELVSRSESRLLIVDVQEKLVPSIANSERMLANCRQLIRGAAILNVPVFATEQYPKGLGHTVPVLAELLASIPEKQRFSCSEVLNWGLAAEQADNRFQIVVAGIEAHVCVLQTVLDLLAAGFQVFVVADAISSRDEFDWQIALNRMSDSGATIVTTESVLFEWCEVSGTPEFKQISQLIKDKASGTTSKLGF
jgi:isochorismate hydrolase